ncbi:MAG: hypothetical protein OK457_08205 [Thaumarchaeota archaeon]|nr:hypothetical protein [Nitrososphaerota archaeon]
MMAILWLIGAAGYYSSLIIWIIAQRTHWFHGKYSHSWMIGALLLVFGTLQILGAPSSLIASAGLISLIMPVIVTSIDVDAHRREGRGLLEHKSHCWMEKTRDKVRKTKRPIIVENENWSSR